MSSSTEDIREEIRQLVEPFNHSVPEAWQGWTPTLPDVIDWDAVREEMFYDFLNKTLCIVDHRPDDDNCTIFFSRDYGEHWANYPVIANDTTPHPVSDLDDRWDRAVAGE